MVALGPDDELTLDPPCAGVLVQEPAHDRDAMGDDDDPRARRRELARPLQQRPVRGERGDRRADLVAPGWVGEDDVVATPGRGLGGDVAVDQLDPIDQPGRAEVLPAGAQRGGTVVDADGARSGGREQPLDQQGARAAHQVEDTVGRPRPGEPDGRGGQGRVERSGVARSPPRPRRQRPLRQADQHLPAVRPADVAPEPEQPGAVDGVGRHARGGRDRGRQPLECRGPGARGVEPERPGPGRAGRRREAGQRRRQWQAGSGPQCRRDAVQVRRPGQRRRSADVGVQHQETGDDGPERRHLGEDRRHVHRGDELETQRVVPARHREWMADGGKPLGGLGGGDVAEAGQVGELDPQGAGARAGTGTTNVAAAWTRHDADPRRRGAATSTGERGTAPGRQLVARPAPQPVGRSSADACRASPCIGRSQLAAVMIKVRLGRRRSRGQRGFRPSYRRA
nr:hypothetical protein [Jiangella asiatica]